MASLPPHASRRAELPLDDGSTLVVRALVPEDKDLLVEGFEHMSPQSRYYRFFSPLHYLGPSLLVRLTDLDHHDRLAWIALVRDPDGNERPAGVARYFAMLRKPTSVEMAVTIVDEFQGRGLGSLLVRLLAHSARANGFELLEGQALAENDGMRSLLEHVGASTELAPDGVVDFALDLRSLPPLGDTPREELIGQLAGET